MGLWTSRRWLLVEGCWVSCSWDEVFDSCLVSPSSFLSSRRFADPTYFSPMTLVTGIRIIEGFTKEDIVWNEIQKGSKTGRMKMAAFWTLVVLISVALAAASESQSELLVRGPDQLTPLSLFVLVQ